MNEIIMELILKQNSQIERLFDRFDVPTEEVELNCINIIKQLRTLIEHIVTYYYGMEQKIEQRMDKDALRTIVAFMKKPENNVPFLVKLHNYLQASSSHYVIDEVSAPRLLSKYLPYLYETKKWFFIKFGHNILNNLSIFSKTQINGMYEYYSAINKKISSHPIKHFEDNKERYYVYKSIPIFDGEYIYYETTIGIASNYASKFNRFIVFSRFKIDERYAVKINIVDDFVRVKNNVIPIKIATAYKISIRPCELMNFGKLVNVYNKVQSNLNEYDALMDFMTKTNYGLYDIILSNDSDFEKIKNIILARTDNPAIWPILDRVRIVIKENIHGKNVLRYLLVNMKNNMIKDQYSYYPNYYGLCIRDQPFDSYPIAMELYKHKTSLYYLMEVFTLDDNEEQLFYRKIRNRTNEKGILYHSCDDLNIDEEKADLYIKRINSKLSWSPNSRVFKTGKYYYIEQYEESTKSIVDCLSKLADGGIENYSAFVGNEISSSNYNIDSLEKKEIVLKLFETSKIACIYGPAGTGKSTIAKHISNILKESSKIYISNTHPAVMNMYRKIGGNKKDFMTIRAYLHEQPASDILFIDECSMVSNDDMCKILNFSKFKYLVLLGDVSQIQSIDYGTWFKVVKALLNKNAKHELTELHRTTLPELTTLWEKVRNKEEVIDEILSDYACVKELDDDSLFEYFEKQIILCLNYDGLYGINNLNLILQEKNKGKSFKIGSYNYKTNDPVLFTENNKFSKVLYNNLKGKITNVIMYEDYAEIFLRVDTNINVLNLEEFEGLELLKVNEDNTSDISIKVERQFDSDDDEHASRLVPFQIAYAVSIHKAQGLEYEKVKVVIGENFDELVTYDVFYTAITRATKRLEIYWTQNTQKNVLNNIIKPEDNKDIAIFVNKFGYKIREKY